MSELETPPAAETPTWLLFRVGQRDYAIPLDRVTEVVAARKPHLIPLVPSAIGGILNTRGEPLPVVDGGAAVEGFACGATRHALVLERDDVRLGVLVDSVLRIDGQLDPSRLELVDAPASHAGVCSERRRTATGVELSIVETDALLARAMRLLAGHSELTTS